MAQSDSFAPEFERFYDFARQAELRFPRCSSCGKFHWYPMKRCPHCLGEDIAWAPVTRNATLFSWTIVRHAFDPAFSDDIPFAVGLVEFPDAPGVRLVTNLVDVAEGDIRIGMELSPVFEASNDPHPRVKFRPAEGQGRS